MKHNNTERQFLTPLHALTLIECYGYNVKETKCGMYWQKAFAHKNDYILYTAQSNLYDATRPVLPALTITETIGFFMDETKGRRFFHSTIQQLMNNQELQPQYAE